MVCELRAPIFDGTHYKIWKARMITIFKSEDLWEIVHNGIEDYYDMEAHGNKKAMDPNSKDVRMKDAKALGIIQGAVTTGILFKIIHEQTANGAWNFLSREVDLPKRAGASGPVRALTSAGVPIAGYTFDVVSTSSAQLCGRNYGAANTSSPQLGGSEDAFWLNQKPRMCKVGDIMEYKKNFKPNVISIGPDHHDSPELKRMIQLKEKILTDVIFKDMQDKRPEVRNAIQKYIKDKVDEVHRNYVEEMILQDGCFILAIIHQKWRKGAFHKFREENQAHKFNFVIRDLFLLENQIPYGAIQVILNFIEPGNTVEELGQEFIDEHYNIKKNKSKQLNKVERQVHLLGHLRTFLTPKVEQSTPKRLPKARSVASFKLVCKRLGHWVWNVFNIKNETSEVNSIQNITELIAAGIQLKPSTEISLSPHRMIFSQLKLPQIIVDDNTELVFRNLMAYEICPSVDKFTFTSYVCFLDELIDSPEDVMQLRKARVLVNQLGSDQMVADLFNKITINVSPNPDVFREVKKQIQEYYETRWKVWIAEAYHNYFSSPWTFISFMAALYLLLLTTYTSLIPKSDCDSLCGHLKKTL